MKKVLGIALLTIMCTNMFAQSGTNSPYSQFGWGVLAEQTNGFNRGMNGLGIGFHERNQVNFLNPASYSELDSLTFLFDAGLSLHLNNLSENGKKRNAYNANLEYVTAGFRATRHLGISFGVMPYTNVGYDYSSTQHITQQIGSTTYTNRYTGSGGLHQIYLGAGWQPVKGLSVGANLSYLFGNYNRVFLNSYSDATTKTVSQTHTAEVRSYKIDLGAQYTAKLSAKEQLTLGVTFSPGHEIGGNPSLNMISRNSQTNVADTTAYGGNMKLSIPTTYGAGLMWNHDQKWKLGVDYSLQKWASLKFPEYIVNNNVASYALRDNMFSDRHKLTFGGDYCPSPMSRNFFNRVHYRVGVSYATSYIKINGNEGPKEISAGIGFGLPIINAINNRSILNISAQWVRSSAKNYITENTFRINIGLTFNEVWFMKWKAQ